MNAVKYVLAALVAAAIMHLAAVHAAPRILMDKAIERIGHGNSNSWRVSDRVTSLSRTVVRPSPDFAYAACPYDLGEGPIVIRVAPWEDYWSLSLYAENSDNFFVLDDREARQGAEITLVRRGRAPPEDVAHVVESPSRRGVALVRRLAPTLDAYNAAARVAREDVCASVANLVR